MLQISQGGNGLNMLIILYMKLSYRQQHREMQISERIQLENSIPDKQRPMLSMLVTGINYASYRWVSARKTYVTPVL